MSDPLILEANPAVFITTVAGLGLMVGSFLNVVVHRLPRMLHDGTPRELAGVDEDARADRSDQSQAYGLVVPRSHCPHCCHPLTVWQVIPVVSYVAFRGRCAWCGWRIPIRYPVVELLSAGLSAMVAWRFGYGAPMLGALLMTWGLITLAAIDAETQQLPDIITVPFLWTGLALNLGEVFTPPSSAVLGAIGGYLSLWVVFHVFRLLTGKEAMGYGDFKLMAALGAWLGWQVLILVLLFSSAIGLVAGAVMVALGRRRRSEPFPFGPYLATAGWVCVMWGEDILSAYLRWAM